MSKKLIEVALPLEAINAEAAREKSIRHGHPSTLHLWWARRPLAAARAVIWSSLVDDPSSHPELYPTEEAQNAERQRLLGILEKLVKWENSNNPDVLNAAKAEILRSTNNNPPALLDPFAGGGAIPLVKSFELSKKKGNTAWAKPLYDETGLHFEVHRDGKPSMDGTVSRKGIACAHCGAPVDFAFLRNESKSGRMSAKLMAVVGEGKKGRIYITPDEEQQLAAQVSKPDNYPTGTLSTHFTGGSCVPYGLDEFDKLFTNRQLTALTTFSSLVAEAQAKAETDAVAAGIVNDHITLSAGGSGARAYGEAVGVYLAFVIDKMTDYNSSICSWHNSGEKMRNTFGRQAIPMVWDYAEANPFCSSSGSYENMLDWVVRCVELLPAQGSAEVSQFDAQSDCGLRNIMVSSDPPYYDNIGYADLSDFFYVWMRQSLKNTYPKLFRTMLVPKAEELVATPYRFEGSTEKARDFFEDGMLHTCQQIYQYAREDIPVTIYYAYKQSDTDEKADGAKTASTGWETMLSAIIKAGFAITGTWPMRTEMANRSIASGTNALASSIVLVCRKRPADAPQATRRSFIAELKRELRPALQKLQRSNIAPVDLAQSAIGPGMGVYSRYARVLEADGSPMTVRSALQIINQELDVYFNEQNGELDANSRFCVDLYTQNAFNNIKFGDADTLARAKNTSVAALASKGVLSAEKGIVRLLTREEIPEKVEPQEENIWLLCQQLTRAMETGGVEACAQIVAPMLGSNCERSKDLAYRLYTLTERKGWAQEGYAYNALVVAWREIQSRAAEIRQATPEQTSFF